MLLEHHDPGVPARPVWLLPTMFDVGSGGPDRVSFVQPSELAERIGDRLHGWRTRLKRDEQYVAEFLTRRGLDITAAALQAIEAGLRLPTTADATRLAAAFGNDLGDLLAPTDVAPVAPAGWSAEKRASELAATRQLLVDKDADPVLAQRFNRRDISAKTCATWCKHFAPDVALEWIEAGFKTIEARNLAKEGLSASVVRVCDSFGQHRDADLVRPARELEGLGVAPIVAALCVAAGVDLVTARRWRDAGWDLLAALPWLDGKLSACDAAAWNAGGFGTDDARRLHAKWRHADAAALKDLGYPEGEWTPALLDWDRCGVPAGLVQRWRANNFVAADAVRWAPISPERAHRLRVRGLSASEAHERDEAGQSRLVLASVATAAATSTSGDTGPPSGPANVDSKPPICPDCGVLRSVTGHCYC